MDARFSLILIVALGLAVFIGVLAAQSQTFSAVPPPPTQIPTPVPEPQPGQIFIAPSPSGGPTFAPARATLHVGQKITWMNVDTVDHSVTADNRDFDKVLSQGESFSWKPVKPGRYPYGDIFNPDLRGVIIVKP
jgi:plastocyanin